MKKIILASCFLFSGCVTFGQMDTGLNSLVGKDKKVAFDVLGYPSQEQTFDSEKVYTWVNSTSGVMVYSAPETTYGTIGNKQFNAVTNRTNAIPVEYNCKIQIVTDTTGAITKYNYDGSIGGCESYIQRLNRYTKS